MTKEENIYLVDGNSLCYRAFYAIKELSTSKGMPTNAIYGMVSMLRKLIKDHAPRKMVVVFDMKGPTARHEKFSGYKINRKPMPDELIEQMPRIKEVIKALSIATCELQGYEADDIIATMAEKAKKKGYNVTIVSSDKDALQLVDSRVKVLSLRTDADKVYDADEVRKKYGVGPEDMTELMAFTGDASDNVPGVKGVGEVTAGKLIGQFRSVDGVYKNIDKVSSESLKKKLIEGRDMAQLSRELVVLDRHVPVEFDPAKTAVGEPDREKLTSLYKEFEFGKLLQEVAPKSEEAGRYVLAGNKKDLDKAAEDFSGKKKIAISVVRDQEKGAAAGIALSAEKGCAFFVPFGAECKGEGVIAGILGDAKTLKIAYDLKTTILALRNAGIEIKSPCFDVMIADYLADPSMAKHDLAGMAMRLIGYNLPEEPAGGKWDDKGQATMDLSSAPSVDWSGECRHADVVLRLHEKLDAELEEKHLYRLFEEVEMPLVEVLSDMEAEGVGLDVKYLKKVSSAMEKKLDGVTERIYELAGEKFNINSPKQLQAILFDKLKLTAGKKTKTGASTDESVLLRLAKENELARVLLEYREMSKLKSGYYDSLLSLVDAKTGRLHTHFNQAVTATGRLSSSEPNLQNIPIKTEMGRDIRRAFIPRGKGRVLLAADYSQIELRILAHLSLDTTLIGAFERGEDVHRFTAALIYGLPASDVTDDMRAVAKTVNFGVIYGMSSFRLAKDLGIGIDEAQGFIDSYFTRYEGVRSFIERTIAGAGKTGYVTTLLNRRRYIPEINSRNERLKGFAERVAVNTPVQGSAADLIKMAMIACHREFRGTDIKMIIQVHDELVFDIPEKDVKKTAGAVRKLMEGVMDLKVPLKVSVESGENWCDMEEVRSEK